LSKTSSRQVLGFIPDIVGAHTTVFRSALPHSEEFVDEVLPDDEYFGEGGELYSPEEKLRVEIERDLREQMQRQLNRLQEDVDQRIEEFAARFEEQREASLQQLRAAAAELALAAAKRVVRSELRSDSEFIVRLVEEAVGEAACAAMVTLRVHPDDAEHLREKPELLLRLRVEEVVGDPTLEPGDCVVESGSRSWDATLESQLRELEDRVRSALELA
jgi:flagellar biosynthesis/type III secretory pathway protein FliH